MVSFIILIVSVFQLISLYYNLFFALGSITLNFKAWYLSISLIGHDNTSKKCYGIQFWGGCYYTLGLHPIYSITHGVEYAAVMRASQLPLTSVVGNICKQTHVACCSHGQCRVSKAKSWPQKILQTDLYQTQFSIIYLSLIVKFYFYRTYKLT